MYTIGQFSRICRVTAKALRHYEKIGLLAPARVKPVNQYRYYTSEQVALLNQITFMKELGIPLKVIKRMIDRQEGPEEVANLLEGIVNTCCSRSTCATADCSNWPGGKKHRRYRR